MIAIPGAYLNANPLLFGVSKYRPPMVMSSTTVRSFIKKQSSCLVANVGIIFVARRPAPLTVKPTGTFRGNSSSKTPEAIFKTSFSPISVIWLRAYLTVFHGLSKVFPSLLLLPLAETK